MLPHRTRASSCAAAPALSNGLMIRVRAQYKAPASPGRGLGLPLVSIAWVRPGIPSCFLVPLRPEGEDPADPIEIPDRVQAPHPAAGDDRIPLSEKKCIKSQEYASENGLPKLENVLLPKTKGFICCLQELRSSLDAVYDVTIAYKHQLPDFLDNVYGVDPSEVHIHIRTVHLCDIPTSEDEVTEWMIEVQAEGPTPLRFFLRRATFPTKELKEIYPHRSAWQTFLP